MDPLALELRDAQIRGIVTLDAGRAYLLQVGQLSQRPNPIPKMPVVGPLALALVEASDEVVQCFQEQGARNIQADFGLVSTSFPTGAPDGVLRGWWVTVMQEAVDQAISDGKPITARAVKLLKDLVNSGMYAELGDTLSRAEASKTADATESVARSPSQGAAFSGTQTSFGSSATTFHDALTLAMKASFFREQLTEEELLTAASLLGTDFSAA